MYVDYLLSNGPIGIINVLLWRKTKSIVCLFYYVILKSMHLYILKELRLLQEGELAKYTLVKLPIGC